MVAHKLTRYLTVLLQNLTYVPFQNIIMTKLKELFNKYLKQANDNGSSLSQEIYLDLEPVVTTGKTV